MYNNKETIIVSPSHSPPPPPTIYTKEIHIDEVFGPRTSVCSTSSEEEDVNNDPDVSSVSVAVNSPILEAKQLQRESTEIDYNRNSYTTEKHGY